MLLSLILSTMSSGANVPVVAVPACRTVASVEMPLGAVDVASGRNVVELEGLTAIVSRDHPSMQLGWIGLDDRGELWIQLGTDAPPALRSWAGPSPAPNLFAPMVGQRKIPSQFRLAACRLRSNTDPLPPVTR